MPKIINYKKTLSEFYFNPAHYVRDKVVNDVKSAGRSIAKVPIVQKAGEKWKAGENYLDTKLAPEYNALNKGVRKTNDWAWKNRDKITDAKYAGLGLAGKVPKLIDKAVHIGQKKPVPPKINTRKVALGAASFADDAAMLALKAGDYKEGNVISEHPVLIGLGAVGAAGAYHAADTFQKKVQQGYRWVKKNPKEASQYALGAAGIAAGIAGINAWHNNHVNNMPYSQGGMFKDPYFQRSEEYNGGSTMINENLRSAIDRISAGANHQEARELIHQELGARVMDGLENKKAEIASAIFTPSLETEEEEDEPVEEGFVTRTLKGAGKGAAIGAAGGAAIGGTLAGPLGFGAGARLGATAGAAIGGAKAALDDDDDDDSGKSNKRK